MNQGIVSQKEIAKNMADKSSLTIGDITIQRRILQGKSVNLEGSRYFSSFESGEGAENEQDFNVNMIKG